MLEIFCKNTASRLACFLLIAIFLSSSPAGATALAICLDAEKTHVVDQEHLHLADCHFSVAAEQPVIYEYLSSRADQEGEECIDISLSNSNALIRPSNRILPVFAKVIFSGVLIGSNLGFQENSAGQMPSVLNQPQFLSPSIDSQRTVVLLI